ncbi:MAG: hypothetical protein L6W00_22365 [Lentisphaeria bacterium]|nr:MAG: hypothetical protein L6W00_22365 [Lentisphaeria bacterium]
MNSRNQLLRRVRKSTPPGGASGEAVMRHRIGERREFTRNTVHSCRSNALSSSAVSAASSPLTASSTPSEVTTPAA